jgi:hypothetical protein
MSIWDYPPYRPIEVSTSIIRGATQRPGRRAPLSTAAGAVSLAIVLIASEVASPPRASASPANRNTMKYLDAPTIEELESELGTAGEEPS